MGEERRDCSVVNKIIRAPLTPCSPEALMVLTPPVPTFPPDKPMDLSARWHGQEVISKNATDCSPDDIAALVLLVPRPDPDLPSTSVSPASPSNDLISNGDQSTTLSAVKNDTHETETKAHFHAVDAVNERNKTNVMRSLEVRHEGAGTPCSHAGPVIHRPAPDDTALPITKIREGDQEPPTREGGVSERSNECRQKNVELAPQVPDNPKLPDAAAIQYRWPCQDGIIRVETSAGLCLAEPAALTPPPSCQRLCPSLVLEVWLRRMPPERGGERRVPCYAVSKKTRPSAVKHSPSHGIAHILSDIPPTSPEWARVHWLLKVEIHWRARSKPPDTLGDFQRPSTNIVSATAYMGAIRSWIRWEVPMLPSSRPSLANARAINPGCVNVELVSRV
ncbi:hypothetical protein AX14_008012, partial [Amanita brunnescens Koide BX004]